MQVLLLYYRTKQNSYANFLYQCLIELLVKQNVFIYQPNTISEAKSAIKTNQKTAIVIHQNKFSLSFINRLQLLSVIKKNSIQWLVQINSYKISSRLPQLIVVNDAEKWSKTKPIASSIKIAVCSAAVKQKLIALHQLPEHNIQVIRAAADDVFQPVNWSKKQSLKMEYTQGKEYFFVSAAEKTFDSFMSLLKAFSIFKKWQHSGMKLLVFGRLLFSENKEWQEKFSSYKYRDDVRLLQEVTEAEQASLLASAYLFIHTPLKDDDVMPLLQAMQCETPCISFVTESVKEYAEDAAILLERNNYEQLGEKMILLYKDENLRNRIIDKGKEQTKLYSKENTMKTLQSAIPANLFE